MNDVLVKVCGLTSKPEIDLVVEEGGDFVGCVFFPPSPRHIDPIKAASITEDAGDVAKVAVVVDASEEMLEEIVSVFRPDYIQLHGNETVEDVLMLKQRYDGGIIKAVKVCSGDDIAKNLQYLEVVDMVLFDAKAPKDGVNLLPGGNGLVFDWQLLAHRNFSQPWFLSGGLHVDNVEDALDVTGAGAVDVSSGVESAPGVKDLELMRIFIRKVKQYESKN